MDYGCYCTFTWFGGTCVVQPLIVVRVVQCTSDRRSGVANLYSQYFQLGKLYGSALCRICDIIKTEFVIIKIMQRKRE